MKPEVKAVVFFTLGVEKSKAFDRGMKQVRRDGMDAAFAFIQARELVPAGQWTEFLDLHSDEVSPRTVRFWCQLADEAVLWVKDVKPQLKLISEIQAAARELVMQSPKPLIALCRELGHMRKFGEYDAVKYATKRLSAGQIEFDFEKVLGTLEVLRDHSKYTFTFPEGRDRKEVIAEARTLIASASKTLDELEGEVIEA